MLYCGIGSPFYSISEAVSADGYEWQRGPDGSNISLLPTGENAWENRMVEYPMVLVEGDRVRLFYCGNGCGATGVGTAVARLDGKEMDDDGPVENPAEAENP
jgi:hypothetical protein